MARRVALYLVGSLVLVSIAGCGRGFFQTAEREAWRGEAELACLKSGEVKEGANLVRISPISGPGVCGADYPLKVAALGESSSLGFADDPRPPGSIPGAGARVPRELAAPQTYPSQTYPSQTYPSQTYSPQAYPQTGDPARYGAVERQPIAAPATYPARSHGGAYGDGSSTAAPMSLRAPTLAPADEDAADEPANQGQYQPYQRSAPQSSYRAPQQAPLPALGPPRGEVAAIGPVAVKPAATLACPIVSQLDRWIADAVQPAAQRWFGVPVVEIKQISAYSCRGMNGNPNAHISEHAFGNALDVAAFTLADGRRISVQDGWHGVPEEQGFLRDVQGGACQLFNTVLAPGSNAYHSDHIHVDLMRRASGRVICQPAAVSGDEVAARAGGRYAGRYAGVTGSISQALKRAARRFAKPSDGEWVEDESGIRDSGR